MPTNSWGPNWGSPLNLIAWLIFVAIALFLIIKVILPLLLALVHSI